MSKSFYILSTLTADQEYTAYREGGADLPVAVGSVLVKGGANVADKRLVTPQGVVTKVDADQMAVLESNEVFQLHKKNGYITVSERKPADPDAAAASQANRDGSAPMVEGDFKEGEGPASVGAATVDDKGTGSAQTTVAPQARPASNPRRA
jgi:hypothetical protein